MKLLFLILTFTLLGFFDANAVAPVLPDESNSFSSIVITAPRAEKDGPTPPHATLALPHPMRKYKAEGGNAEPFGYGRLFVYNTGCDFGDISIPFTHRNILERLREYKETDHRTGKYGESNLLLVRVRFSCVNPKKIHSFECFFGLFSSGVTKKHDCKTLSQTYAGQQFFVLAEPLQREFISDLLLSHPLLREHCLLDRDVPIVGYDVDVHPYKLFKLNGHTAKRVIFSNADYVKSDKPHRGFNKNLLQRSLDRLRIPSAAAGQFYKTFFDCTEADLVGKEDKIGIYFNQSEQAFFNSLETDDVEAFFGSTAPRISEVADDGAELVRGPAAAAASKARAGAAVASEQGRGYRYKTTVDMYSYRDICVVCRGYISSLLANEWWTHTIQEAIRKKSDTPQFAIEPITEIYAHSVIDTEVQIEKPPLAASAEREKIKQKEDATEKQEDKP